MNSELVPLTLTIKVKFAFKLQQYLKKMEPFFNTPSNLKCELIIQAGWMRGGGETPFFANAKNEKKALTSFCSLVLI